MRCPRCNKEGCKYIVNRTKVIKEKKKLVKKRKNLSRKKRSLRFGGQSMKKNIEPRTDFRAICSDCKWEGEIKL